MEIPFHDRVEDHDTQEGKVSCFPPRRANFANPSDIDPHCSSLKCGFQKRSALTADRKSTDDLTIHVFLVDQHTETSFANEGKLEMKETGNHLIIDGDHRILEENSRVVVDIEPNTELVVPGRFHVVRKETETTHNGPLKKNCP